MEEKNQSDPPQRYVWPWFVLGAVVLGVVLAFFWMSALVHRVHEQRESDHWPAARQPAQPISSPPISSQAVPPPQTNSSAPGVHVDPVRK